MFIIMTSHRWTRVFCFVDLAKKTSGSCWICMGITYTTNKQCHIISICLRMVINHRIWGTIFHTHTPKREHIFRLSIFSFTCPLVYQVFWQGSFSTTIACCCKSLHIHDEPQRDSYCNVGPWMLCGIPSVQSDRMRHPYDSCFASSLWQREGGNT